MLIISQRLSITQTCKIYVFYLLIFMSLVFNVFLCTEHDSGVENDLAPQDFEKSDLFVLNSYYLSQLNCICLQYKNYWFE